MNKLFLSLIDNRRNNMNIKVFIFSIFGILSNIQTIFTQIVNNNNLVTNEIQILLSNTPAKCKGILLYYISRRHLTECGCYFYLGKLKCFYIY
jgi:hypothetical protein